LGEQARLGRPGKKEKPRFTPGRTPMKRAPCSLSFKEEVGKKKGGTLGKQDVSCTDGHPAKGDQDYSIVPRRSRKKDQAHHSRTTPLVRGRRMKKGKRERAKLKIKRTKEGGGDHHPIRLRSYAREKGGEGSDPFLLSGN